MANMEFTMLSIELRRDPRWRSLADFENARLTYFSLMLNSLVTYTGHFHSPLEIFSYESMIPMHKLVPSLEKLERVGLIEFDHKTEYVRIVGWFIQRRAPKNLNCLKSSLKHYWHPHIPIDGMMARSLAELAVASLVRSRSFKQDSEKSVNHKANYTGFLCKTLEDMLPLNPEIVFALKLEFDTAGRQHQAYFEEIVGLVPSLEKCATLFDGNSDVLDGSATVSEPLANGLGTATRPLINGSRDIVEQFSSNSARRRT